MDQDPGRVFYAKPFLPGEREPIPLEKIREMLIKQLTDMDEKEIQNMADIIVHLIDDLRQTKKLDKV